MLLVQHIQQLTKYYSEETALEMLRDAGFTGADLSLFNIEKSPRWMGENYKEEAKKLGEFFLIILEIILAFWPRLGYNVSAWALLP